MDMQTTGWDKMGDLTSSGGPSQAPQDAAPFYLAPAVQQKIATVSKANGVSPDVMVNNVKQSIASGKATPDSALKELDDHYQSALGDMKLPMAGQTQQTPISMPQAAKQAPQKAEMPEGLLDSRNQDWLQPLVALSDAVNGTNKLKSYQGPMTKQDWVDSQNKMSTAQNELAMRDAGTQVSQNARAQTLAAAKLAFPNKTDAQLKALVPDTMSAYDIQTDANLKPLISGGLGVQGNQAKADAMNAKNNSFAGRNSIQISKDYEQHMQEPVSVQNSIRRIESVLTTPIISKQQLGDVNAAISNIFSPKHQSDATVSRTEYESMPAEVAGALQKLTANPHDIGSRELIKHVLDQAYHIGNVTNRNAQQQIDSLDAGYSTVNDPAIQKIAKAKSDFFKQRFGTDYQTSGDQQTTSPQMKAPSGRVTVKDKNGNIGHIPQAQLDDAIKQGYQEVK